MDWLTGYKLKTSNETRTSTTALADDAVLFFDPTASTTYFVQFMIHYDAGATSDFKFTFECGSPTFWKALIMGTPDSNYSLINSGNRSAVHRTVAGAAPHTTACVCNGNDTAGVEGWLWCRALLITDAGGERVKFRYAQNSSSVNAVTVFAGSWLTWEIVT